MTYNLTVWINVILLQHGNQNIEFGRIETDTIGGHAIQVNVVTVKRCEFECLCDNELALCGTQRFDFVFAGENIVDFSVQKQILQVKVGVGFIECLRVKRAGQSIVCELLELEKVCVGLFGHFCRNDVVEQQILLHRIRDAEIIFVRHFLNIVLLDNVESRDRVGVDGDRADGAAARVAATIIIITARIGGGARIKVCASSIESLLLLLIIVIDRI